MLSLKLSYQPSLKFSMAVIETAVRFLNLSGDLVLVLLTFKITIFSVFHRKKDQHMKKSENLGILLGRSMHTLQKDISMTCAFISTLTYTCSSFMAASCLIFDVFLL